MRKNIILSILFLSITNLLCAQFEIKVKIDGHNNQAIKFGHHSGSDIIVVDSATTNANGYAVLKGNYNLQHGIYFVSLPNSAYFNFLIAEDKHFNISTHQYKLLDSLKVENNTQYNDYIRFQQKTAENNKQKFQLNIEKQFYQKNKDSVVSYEKKIKSLDTELTMFIDSLYNKNKGNALGDILHILHPVEIPQDLEQNKGIYSKEYFFYINRHFFDNVNFEENAIINAPPQVFEHKLKQYCKYFIDARFDNIEESLESVDHLFEITKKNPTAQKFVAAYLIDNYENSTTLGLDAIFVHISRNHLENNKLTWANREMISRIKKRADLMEKNLVGEQAMNLIFPDENGEMHSLLEGNGRYSVLWFYETNCELCKTQTPELYKLYEGLKVMNIDVTAINIDNREADWKTLIESNGYDWLNLCNVENNPNLMEAYGVFKTPRIYILNPKGKIIAKDIMVSHLMNYFEFLDERSQSKKNEFIFNN